MICSECKSYNKWYRCEICDFTFCTRHFHKCCTCENCDEKATYYIIQYDGTLVYYCEKHCKKI